MLGSETIHGAQICAGGGRISGRRPVVFLLPGLLGSRLQVAGKLIWPCPVQLALGGLSQLRLSTPNVRPDGPIKRRYGSLAAHLGNTHDVIPFDYDWRLSMADGADRLNRAVLRTLGALQGSDQPVRFVGHSMGGLLVRAMIARHRKTWEAVCTHPGARLLMLGPPNQGAMAAVCSLLGLDRQLRLLQTLTPAGAQFDVFKELAALPGFLELLPTNYLTASSWDDLISAGHQAPSRDALKAAHAVRTKIQLLPEHADRMTMILGQSPATPAGAHSDHKGIRMLMTRAGDGRVSWAAASLPGVSQWFAPETDHAALPRSRQLFPAITEILINGRTNALPNRPLVGLRDAQVYEKQAAALALPNIMSAMLSGLTNQRRIAA